MLNLFTVPLRMDYKYLTIAGPATIRLYKLSYSKLNCSFPSGLNLSKRALDWMTLSSTARNVPSGQKWLFPNLYPPNTSIVTGLAYFSLTCEYLTAAGKLIILKHPIRSNMTTSHLRTDISCKHFKSSYLRQEYYSTNQMFNTDPGIFRLFLDYLPKTFPDHAVDAVAPRQSPSWNRGLPATFQKTCLTFTIFSVCSGSSSSLSECVKCLFTFSHPAYSSDFSFVSTEQLTGVDFAS